jgi:hypothetical protein
MSFLRRIDDKISSGVWILICGSDPLHQYKNSRDGSPAMNTKRRVIIPDLEFSARRRMIAEPFIESGRLPPSDSATRTVDYLAGGQVWILTLLLERVFKDGTEDPDAIAQLAEDMLEGMHEVLSDGGIASMMRPGNFTPRLPNRRVLGLPNREVSSWARGCSGSGPKIWR